MTHHDHEARAEPLRRKLDTTDLRGSDNVPRNSNDEEISQALIKDQLGRNPGVGTAKHDGEGLLASE